MGKAHGRFEYCIQANSLATIKQDNTAESKLVMSKNENSFVFEQGLAM
jgi:hypothetical protein